MTQCWGILWLLPEPWQFWHHGGKIARLTARCRPHMCCGCPRFFGQQISLRRERASSCPSSCCWLPWPSSDLLISFVTPAHFFSVLLLFDFLPPAWILGENDCSMALVSAQASSAGRHCTLALSAVINAARLQRLSICLHFGALVEVWMRQEEWHCLAFCCYFLGTF